MSEPMNDSLRTRTSLIGRLGNWRDDASWERFLQTYWRLIYGFARKAGLTVPEAEDVLQETLLAVAMQFPAAKYDRAFGPFKTWLLQCTRWHIADQFRKRSLVPFGAPPSSEALPPAAPIEDFADPSTLDLDLSWEVDWKERMLEAATENVKKCADPRTYQIFDFCAIKGWPPDKVAATFRIPIGQVYLAKHRITQLLRAEVNRLEKADFQVGCSC